MRLSVLLLVLFASVLTAKTVDDKLKQIILDYAPKIWYHPAEKNFAGSIRYFLKYMSVFKDGQKVAGQPSTLDTTNLNFQSSSDSEKSYLDFSNKAADHSLLLRGLRPSYGTPRSYAIVSNKPLGIVDVHYIQFYPFQTGQIICGGTKTPTGGCNGGYLKFNNRIGDWSRVTLRVKNGSPYAYYVSAHKSGEKILLSSRNATFEHNHIQVYCSLGTHDLYVRPGQVVYKTLSNGEQLVDNTRPRGTAWDTWKNLKILEFKGDGSYSDKSSWMGFRGRWGPPQSDCQPGHTKLVPGHCGTDNGITSPALRSYQTSSKLQKKY